jgi:streptogramin lyase
VSSRYERYRPCEPAAAAGWTLETLVQPAPFFGANGIRIGPDGRCWVAEVRGASISAWDAETGEIGIVSPNGGSLAGPDDLALGPDGSIYVAEYTVGAVARIRPDGVYERLFEESPKANGITVDAGGRLFVDEWRAGGQLYELDPHRPGRPRIIAEVEYPNALERAADGRLYLQEVVAGTICSIDPDEGGLRREFDGIEIPSAVKIDPLGRVAVTEFLTGFVYAFDLETRERTVLAELPPGLDNLCFDAAGRLYVSNAETCEVVRIVDGRVDASSGDGLLGPYGLTADANGAVYAADNLRLATARDGRAATVWQYTLPGRPHLINDAAWCDGRMLAVGGAGDIIRLDIGAEEWEVVVHTSAGAEAVAISARSGGAVLARADGRLVELDAAGAVTAEYGGGAQVSDVSGNGGTIAVCDAGAGTVTVFADGPASAVTHDGFDQPEAVVGDGGVFVAETGARRITWLAVPDGRRSPVATELPLGFPNPHPRSGRRASLAPIAGGVVVGCDGDGSIRRLRRS